MKNKLIFPIGLSLISGVGPITAKKIISYCGGVEAVFNEKRSNLLKIPQIGVKLADEISRQSVLIRAEQEINFMLKNGIDATTYLDKNYPYRLKECIDSPILLYSKGKVDWNQQKVISIVGNRSSTQQGKEICEKLINDLSEHNVLVVSGLAYGIDALAHKYSIKNNLSTVAFLAHGLDKIYPSSNYNLAKSMLESGGWISEFISNTKLSRENFVRRNRIVAGISDATVVVESKQKGGAMITAKLSNDYSREVFAFPGRPNDECSVGCNHLIKTNQAHLCQSVNDFAYHLNWNKNHSSNQIQMSLFNDEEQLIIDLLKENSEMHVDKILSATNFDYGKMAILLTNLELKNVIYSKPGKVFCVKSNFN